MKSYRLMAPEEKVKLIDKECTIVMPTVHYTNYGKDGKFEANMIFFAEHEFKGDELIKEVADDYVVDNNGRKYRDIYIPDSSDDILDFRKQIHDHISEILNQINDITNSNYSGLEAIGFSNKALYSILDLFLMREELKNSDQRPEHRELSDDEINEILSKMEKSKGGNQLC